VIAHDDELYALAGLMGASQSAVQAQTQQVLIEAASFNPSAVRSMRFLGLTTEASGRFERGVDRHYQLRLLKIFAGLMQSVDETLECLVPIDLLKDERLPTEIALTQQDVDRLVGAAIDVQETQKIMLALGGEHDGYSITFQVPSWRFDLSIKQDIIEEIVRLYGLDRLPLAPARHRYLPIKLASSLDPWIHLGFNEVITYSFMSEQDAQLFTRQELIALANPMSQEMAVLRPSLWPSLLAVSALNARFGSRGLQLVEQASVYGEHYEQRQRSVVAAVLMIENAQRHWSSTQKKRNLDFYDVKGLLEQILAHHLDLEFEQTDSYPGLHPQLQINIKVNGIVQGIFGQLHPLLSHQKEWPMSWLIEFNADLMEGAVTKTYQAFSRLPKIHRDLALIVPQTIPVAKIIRFIENNQSQALQSVHVFDYYSGEHVAEGFISLGVELVFQHPTKTLEEIEIGLSIQKILLELKNEYGITLRD
jgi:phenylalanyl-tRNA synthetase beta chain